MINITTEINSWIKEHGNERDALNVAITRINIAKQEIKWLREEISQLRSEIEVAKGNEEAGND